MPMYFFDVLERDGKVTHDVIGVELAGPRQALDAASRTLMDSLQQNGMQHLDFSVQIIVRDEQGHELGRRDAAIRRSDEKN
ncbi:MAG: hypothetical protein EON56_01450 [Alphaproteobacteria bacterium]|nr:MAG: hypothetical protein EON56_01450 [Alphaproteobacteria bacterium]